MKLRMPDCIAVYSGKRTVTSEADVILTVTQEADALVPILTAGETPISYVCLSWQFRDDEERNEPVRVLGDTWERGYGDLEWRGIAAERVMPWYCMVSNGSDSETDCTNRRTECFGVRVRPNAFCSWQYSESEVTLILDLRNGSEGVLLGGRTLRVAEILFADYIGISAYESGEHFCRQMCTDPLLPAEPVYGFNNWYYAYGKSSSEEILADTDRLADCCGALPVRPYMIIDDGWQLNACDGPWDITNERFPDMRALAAEIAHRGAKPGLWFRPLYQHSENARIPENWRLTRNPAVLDPSVPEVLDYVEKTLKRFRDWGYRLVKHDFTTYDILGKWGMEMPGVIEADGWTFADHSRTTAEIILELYRRIRHAAGDMVVIGCNTVSHLCAGLAELMRTGDDTSGMEWKRTRKMGVNTVAFRSIQNRAFYMADADCSGITPNIDWKLNARWLRLLSYSDSPLFVSWNPICDIPVIREAVTDAFRENIRPHRLVPLDWMENRCPQHWLIDGVVQQFDWNCDDPSNLSAVPVYLN